MSPGPPAALAVPGVRLGPCRRDHDADMNVEDDPSGRIERAMGLLRRILQYQVSIAALIEVALLAGRSRTLSIGFVWTLLHTEQTQRIQTRLERVSPAGAERARPSG